ncbi:pro-opiomelanocortin-like [Echeneis naucrates]|uniref:pro-opiomelanocortin-like n=1 Tax=Echeneis naucrates TaxID=173247 RepID=UPI001113DDC8|nr:pro-opiomelanocortin [Echeneis naucrates]
MCPAWLLVSVLVVDVTRGVISQCWEQPSCRDVSSESSMMECIQLCRADLTAETPLFPGSAHLRVSPLPDPSSSPSPQTKRSYSMEHFRWGKPVGRKRRPVKVYASNSVEEESAEVFPGEMKRDLVSQQQAVVDEQQLLGDLQEKKDNSYKMKHFRWSGPPASKRYGGFMKSWDEHGQRPLLTLFKNVINKDGQQQN